MIEFFFYSVCLDSDIMFGFLTTIANVLPIFQLYFPMAYLFCKQKGIIRLYAVIEAVIFLEQYDSNQ